MGYKTAVYQDFDVNSYTLPKSINMIEQYELWISYWRDNPHRFVKEYLGIKTLKPFQEYILYQMVHNNNFMYIAARRQGKTFITALFIVVMCILYPGTKVVVAAGQKRQAMKIVTEKLPELMNMSPILKEEIDGRLKSNMNNDDPNVKFLNGSWVKITASNDGARSGGANLLILDEFRMIDQEIYTAVLRRMLGSSRQPAYLVHDEYKDMDMEKNKQIFLSSAYYKHNWSYDLFQAYYQKMTEGSRYNVVAFPYQKSIEHKLLDADSIKEEMMEDTFSPIKFNMEMECMFYGENENAFFELNDLEKNRKITQALYPKDIYEYYGNSNFESRKKDRDEIRIISADIARMPGKNNDASAYTILSLRNYNGNWKIHVEYMETMNGGHSKIQGIRIRRLFDDYDCDYIVIDISGIGKSISDRLMESMEDDIRNKRYEPFKFINNDALNESALSGAEERIFGISPTSELNLDIASTLKDYMKRGKIKYLVNSNDAISYVSKAKNYSKSTIEKQAMLQKPYIQIDNFINETISLELKQTSNGSGVYKLVEPRSSRKDRYSSLSYGVYFLALKEKELTRKNKKKKLKDYVFF